MKHKIQKVELFIGVIIFLGGLLTYGLGVHQLLPVPRPDLVVYGTTLIGIILIFMGCDIFSKPTKEMQILENIIYFSMMKEISQLLMLLLRMLIK